MDITQPSLAKDNLDLALQRVVIVTDQEQRLGDLLGYIALNCELVRAKDRQSVLNDPRLASTAAVIFTDRPNDVNAKDFCRWLTRSDQRQRPRIIAAGLKNSPWLSFLEWQTQIDGVLHMDTPCAHQVRTFALLTSQRTEAAIAALGEPARAIWAESRKLLTNIESLIRAGQPIPHTKVHALAVSVIEQSDDTLLFGVIRALRDHHNETLVHSLDVAMNALLLGRHLGIRSKSDQYLLFEGGLLHDVGKAEIPQAILNKPGKLTAEELAVIRQHPLSSERILLDSGDFDQQMVLAAVQHHEKNDGSGYPHGLATRQISEIGRLMAVCDVYSALTERRAYKPQRSPRDAFEIMRGMTGHHLDPVLVERLMEMVYGCATAAPVAV